MCLYIRPPADIIPLLSDSWLDESEKLMKNTLKTKILEIVPAKCDIWKICDVDIFCSLIICCLYWQFDLIV